MERKMKHQKDLSELNGYMTVKRNNPKNNTILLDDLMQQRWKHYNTICRVYCATCRSTTSSGCKTTMRLLEFCPSCSNPLHGSTVDVVRRANGRVINRYIKSDIKNDVNDWMMSDL